MAPRMGTITRRPPKAVRDALVAEVGFLCPVQDCGSPYLTFHHFDPPWKVEHHHRPDGMIALCPEHAGKADGGYYPDEYLRGLKRDGLTKAAVVRGEFDYLRREVVAVIGSNAYYDVEHIVEIDGKPAVSMRRGEDGYQRLSFKLPGHNGAPRAWLEDNVWLVTPDAKNIECPPRGRFLKVEFDNGDMFRLEFRDFEDERALSLAFPQAGGLASADEFPVTVAEFWEKAQGVGIEFGRSRTSIGSNTFADGVVAHGRVGLSVSSFMRPNEITLDPRVRDSLHQSLNAYNALARERRP